MILIADSGSTKTDWIVSGGEANNDKVISTQGINPFHQSDSEIELILKNEVLPRLISVLADTDAANLIKSVAFYGAGCTESVQPKMKNCLSETFVEAKVEVAGDLLGAARALCGSTSGIVCILGTGSNSCFYDGKTIVKNVPPLGYILGDEGSGAALGKLFINGMFKGGLPEAIRELYLREENLTYQDIIENVYRKPLANRYLASTAKFINRHFDLPELEALVRQNFELFFERNVCEYASYGAKNVSAIGSIAYHFRSTFEKAAAKFGFEADRVEQSPIRGMLAYHHSKQA
ncbi:ATPase [Prevotella falsenii]|uniref:ATPase n=1 Tax=Prevotella falsenii TaxID=515414 RepID=UPI00046879C2|nr:ATPase [Prevotella falsenii]